jgi:hypothetical protein
MLGPAGAPSSSHRRSDRKVNATSRDDSAQGPAVRAAAASRDGKCLTDAWCPAHGTSRARRPVCAHGSRPSPESKSVWTATTPVLELELVVVLTRRARDETLERAARWWLCCLVVAPARYSIRRSSTLESRSETLDAMRGTRNRPARHRRRRRRRSGACVTLCSGCQACAHPTWNRMKNPPHSSPNRHALSTSVRN